MDKIELVEIALALFRREPIHLGLGHSGEDGNGRRLNIIGVAGV